MISVFCDADGKTIEMSLDEAKQFDVFERQLSKTSGDCLHAGSIESKLVEQLLALLKNQSLLERATPSQLQQVGLASNYLDCAVILKAVYKEMERRIQNVSTFQEIRFILNIFDDKPLSNEKIEEIKERVNV